MNKRKILLILLVMVSLLSITTGTVAYYRYGINGSINGTTGNYTFNVSSESTTTKEINLGSNLKPFDKGSFNLTVNLNNTDSDANFTVNIERTNLPKGFKFLAQDDNISPFSTYSKTFKSTDTKSDTITVYWYWDGNVDDDNDTYFIGKNISANIVIDSKQLNGAYMKNGYSEDESANGGTEFWSDNYKSYIRTVNFIKNTSTVPKTCNEENLCWDITESGTKKVYAYLTDAGLKDSKDNTKSLYNLYIASDVEIIAPSNCKGIFCLFKNLISIDFNNNFNTANVTDMSGMFDECSSLITLDLSCFDTSNVTAMNFLFSGCTSLTNLDLSSFNTAKVTAMNSMFQACSSLTSLNLSSFNTANVTSMYFLFAVCTSLTNLDLSSFNTAKVTAMNCMFWKCSSLKNIDVSNFNMEKVTTFNTMFRSCTSLTTINLSNVKAPNLTDMSYMFFDCSSLTDANLSNMSVDSLTNMSWLFYNCSSLTTVDLTNFNAPNLTDMSYMFYNCSSLTDANLSNMNTPNITKMNNMFQACSSLTNLNLSNFNTANVTNMNSSFGGCTSLVNLDLSSFNTAKVTDMGYMFSGNKALKNLNISSFTTNELTDIGNLFYQCENLITTLNITSTTITKYTYMFSDTAVQQGAKVAVNYISDASTLVDNMIATKSNGSNIIKGSVIQ